MAGKAATGYCWTKGSADLYDSFGVTADGASVLLASVGGYAASALPSGPQVIP